MRKLSFLLFISWVPIFIIAQPVGKNSYPKPSNYQKRVTLLIEGSPRYYYSLNSEMSSHITVSGPGKLQAITRSRIASENPVKTNYQVQYSIDGGEWKVFTVIQAEPATGEMYQASDLGKPTKARSFEVELGRGDHTIEFKLGSASLPVDVRYIFTPMREKKQEWIAFSPMRPSEPIELITKETHVTYYRFSGEKPLRVEVNGTTELRVLTRIENHMAMKGRIQYRIQVRENGRVINTYQLSSERSGVTTYSGQSELIPGKACEFVILVPKGHHSYEILALDNKSTVLGRLLLPKKDVKLTE